MKFIRPFLDIVSDDGKPDFVVTTGNNISRIFEEYGGELWLMFFLGIIAGIIIHGVARFLIKKLISKFFDETNNSKDQDESD